MSFGLPPLSAGLVPGAGIEPAWSKPRWILSPVRLPVSPPRQKVKNYVFGPLIGKFPQVVNTLRSGFTTPSEALKPFLDFG